MWNASAQGAEIRCGISFCVWYLIETERNNMVLRKKERLLNNKQEIKY